MGNVKEMVEFASKTKEEIERQKKVDSITASIVSKMMKQAKTKVYHWEADETTRKYHVDIYNFFHEEGFEIINFKTEIRKNDKITQERSFDICWK